MPGPKGCLSPERANVEVWEAIAVFNIGATGLHTRVRGGGMSVARTAAGKYTITFTEWGPVLVDLEVTVHRTADAAPLLPRPTKNSFTATAATAPALYETWNVAGTPAQTELTSGDVVTIRATFLKTA